MTSTISAAHRAIHKKIQSKGTVVAQSESVYPVALVLWNMLMAQTNRPIVVAGGLTPPTSPVAPSPPSDRACPQSPR